MLFDAEFRSDLERRYAGRPAWERPDLWFVATSPERAGQRAWMEQAIAGLAEADRARILTRLHDDRSFVTAYHELAVAAILEEHGLEPSYEPTIDGLTPDFVIPGSAHRPTMILEVWTRNRPDHSKRATRAWRVLQGRLAEIAVPVGLLVEGPPGERIPPPTSSQVKQIVRELRPWLLLNPAVGSTYQVSSYRFRVCGPSPDLQCRLAMPHSGGWIDSNKVIETIEHKVRTYRKLAQRMKACLIVVLASEPGAALDFNLLRGALTGRQSFSFTFSPGQSGLIGESQSSFSRNELVPFDPALSAIGWLTPGIEDPGALTLLPIATATREVPDVRGARVDVQGLEIASASD